MFPVPGPNAKSAEKRKLFDVIFTKLQKRMRETPVSSCEKNFLLEVSTNIISDVQATNILRWHSFFFRHYGRDADWMEGDGWTPGTCQSALAQIGDPARLL